MIQSKEFETELEEARQILSTDPQSLVELRPLPAIAAKVNEACNDQNFNTRALAELVECDPAFTSKILSVVNSSMFGYSREVSSVQQALVVLGRKTVAQLAVCIAAQKVFSSGKVAKHARVQLYEHSLACASVNRSLANLIDTDVDSGAAFLAGILHDVGKLIFLDVAPQTYPQLLKDRPPETSSVELENEYFGTDHTHLGILFGDSWNLSSAICDSIATHHSKPTCALSQITIHANLLTKFWGIGQSPDPAPCDEAQEWLADNIKGSPEVVMTTAKEQFEELKKLLSL